MKRILALLALLVALATAPAGPAFAHHGPPHHGCPGNANPGCSGGNGAN